MSIELPNVRIAVVPTGHDLIAHWVPIDRGHQSHVLFVNCRVGCGSRGFGCELFVAQMGVIVQDYW
jgi:hypothetical protein